MTDRRVVALTVNGEDRHADLEDRTTLADALRREQEVTGGRAREVTTRR